MEREVGKGPGGSGSGAVHNAEHRGSCCSYCSGRTIPAGVCAELLFPKNVIFRKGEKDRDLGH